MVANEPKSGKLRAGGLFLFSFVFVLLLLYLFLDSQCDYVLDCVQVSIYYCFFVVTPGGVLLQDEPWLLEIPFAIRQAAVDDIRVTQRIYIIKQT